MNQLIKETNRRVKYQYGYDGVCHRCNSPVAYDGEMVVVEIAETKDYLIVVPVDTYKCPHCHEMVMTMQIYKSLEVSKELAEPKLQKESRMLQEGDIIELKPGMNVYTDVPKHFVYSNCRGDFSFTHERITLSGDFDYLCGRYIVTKTFMGGGGQSNDGDYPNGWHVFCVKEDSDNIKVDFYQSGCFTAMIEDIQPIGKARLKWLV